DGMVADRPQSITHLSVARCSLLIAVWLAGCGDPPERGNRRALSRLVTVDSVRLDGVGSITELRTQPDATFILDSSSPGVHVRSSDHRTQTFGTRGEGPGEFIFPAGLAVTSDGTIFVSDPPLARLTRFKRGASGNYEFDRFVPVSSSAPVVDIDF